VSEDAVHFGETTRPTTMIRQSWGLWACVFLILLSLPTPAVHAEDSPAEEEDGFSFDIVEEDVKDGDVARIDRVKELMSQEKFGEALGDLEVILQEKKLKKYHKQAEYDIAKALFGVGAQHAALSRYQVILDVGPKHPMYADSRSWIFYIGRKIKDELAALQMISTYAKAEDIPRDQQSELNYALARFYFLMALQQGAQGVAVEPAELELELELNEDLSAPDGPARPTEGEEPPASDDSFNFSADDLGGGDDDGFGFDFSDDVAKPQTKPKKSKSKKKEKAANEVPPAAPPPPPAPPPPKTKAKKAAPARSAHKNENPKSAEESLAAALKAIERVAPEYAGAPQATYLKGLIHFARGEFEPSVRAFREVVRKTNPRGGDFDDLRLREMAFFSLARIHYQFEQFRYAIFYYDRISRDSESWLDSIFESSWAHFRLGEYEKALGNLITLQSPFFLDEYYPESSILKAITFFENCRYPEARAFLEEFKQNYDGVLAELERLVGSRRAESSVGGEVAGLPAVTKSAEELFQELTELEQKVADGKDDAARSIALTARLLRLALSDKRVASFREAIAEVDRESELMATLPPPFRGGKMYEELLAKLRARRGELVVAAGVLLREKLEAERVFLKELMSKLLRVEFEIEKMEKEELEASLANQSQAVAIGQYSFTAATDDERLYWPYEGEYWRDELGTYQYTLTKGCRPQEATTITGD
jgi:tetratricopeptide (TPR) repeat protein